MVDFIMAVRSVKDWSYGIGTPTEENSFVVLDQNELPQGLEFYKKEEYHAWHFFTIEEIISLLDRYNFYINDSISMEEPAGIPSWYKGNNSYWVLKATRLNKPKLWRGMEVRVK